MIFFQNMTNTIYEAMTDEMTWLGRVLWPLTFGVAYCVTGLFMVVNEKLLKVGKGKLVYHHSRVYEKI